MDDGPLPEVPAPFHFNVLKHHGQGLMAFVRRSSLRPAGELPEVAGSLVVLGRLMTDLYLGDLEPAEICRDIRAVLESTDCFEETKYRNWIDRAPSKFRIAQVSDGSAWTLLKGRTSAGYLHIHPARNSPKCRRVKSMAMKVALLLVIRGNAGLAANDLLEESNNVRQLLLQEPPLGRDADLRHIRIALDVISGLRGFGNTRP
jgi:hypothetical protein